MAKQISNLIQKVSLPSVWTKKMIAELDKEKEENVQTEITFAQNLKYQIAELNEKLDKLLDLQLSGVISTEEYAIGCYFHRRIRRQKTKNSQPKN